MPQKPTVAQLDWVPSNSGVRVEPSGSKKNQGWSPLEPLPAQNENWILYSLDQWQKYFERVTDGLFFKTFVLGTTQQVTDGYADYDDPQDAYDAAHAAGGGIVLVLPGNIPGNLNINQNSGILIRGSGYDSNLTGNVVISGQRNLLKDLQISGTLEIGGSYNQLDIHHTNNALTNTATNLLNGYVIRKTSTILQSLVIAATPNTGSFKLSYKGNLTAALPYDVSAATIQTELQGLPGLSAATVTGSVGAGFSIVLTGGDQPLLVKENSLGFVIWPSTYMGIYGGPFDPVSPSFQADNPTQVYTLNVYFVETTANIQAGASAATVQAALRALGMVNSYDLNNVIVTQPDGPNTFPILITWVGNDSKPFVSQGSGNMTYMGGGVSINTNNNGGDDYSLAPKSATLTTSGAPPELVENSGSDRQIDLTANLTLTALENGCLLKKMQDAALTVTLPPPMKGFKINFVDATGFNDVRPTTFARNGGTGKIQGLSEDYIFDAADGKTGLECDGTDWFLV